MALRLRSGWDPALRICSGEEMANGHEMAMGRGMLCQRDGQRKLLLCPVCVLQLKRGPARVGFVTD